MTATAPVLLVDGNPHMAAMLQRFLTQHQVDTQTVLSAAEARALLAQHAFQTPGLLGSHTARFAGLPGIRGEETRWSGQARTVVWRGEKPRHDTSARRERY